MSSSATKHNSEQNLFLLETFQTYLTMSLLHEKILKCYPAKPIVLLFNQQYFSNTAKVTIHTGVATQDNTGQHYWFSGTWWQTLVCHKQGNKKIKARKRYQQ